MVLIHPDCHANLGGCSHKGYNLGLRISDLATCFIVWTLQSGVLQSLELQSRAPDCVSCDPFSCLRRQSAGLLFGELQSRALGGYKLGLRTSRLATRSLVWRLQSAGLLLRGLQSRATDFGSCDQFTCLEATVWGATVSGATISGYGLRILRPVHLSGRYDLGSYNLGGYNIALGSSDLATRSLV